MKNIETIKKTLWMRFHSTSRFTISFVAACAWTTGALGFAQRYLHTIPTLPIIVFVVTYIIVQELQQRAFYRKKDTVLMKFLLKREKDELTNVLVSTMRKLSNDAYLTGTDKSDEDSDSNNEILRKTRALWCRFNRLLKTFYYTDEKISMDIKSYLERHPLNQLQPNEIRISLQKLQSFLEEIHSDLKQLEKEAIKA